MIFVFGDILKHWAILAAHLLPCDFFWPEAGNLSQSLDKSPMISGIFRMTLKFCHSKVHSKVKCMWEFWGVWDTGAIWSDTCLLPISYHHHPHFRLAQQIPGGAGISAGTAWVGMFAAQSKLKKKKQKLPIFSEYRFHIEENTKERV